MISKKQIRKQMREQRRALSDDDRLKAANAFCKQIKKLNEFSSAKKIALYLANDGELSPDFVVDQIWLRKKKCFLPVLFGKNTRIMHFAHFTPRSSFISNRFGILEPNVKIRRQQKALQMDLILMPLVAFDKNCNRLGMGGGFYDKSLAFLRNRKHWHKPKLVGVAYDFQEVEQLPIEEWDVPLDYVVTESRVIKQERG